MQRQLLRTSAIMVVLAVLGGLLLMRQARRLARTSPVIALADTIALAPPTDSASFVAAARAAHDVDRRLRGAGPRAVRVGVYRPDSTGVVLLLEPDPADGSPAVWVRVFPSGQAAVTPYRP